MMDEEDFCYCHYDYEDEEHDCLDYMECEECPYYYEDLDQAVIDITIDDWVSCDDRLPYAYLSTNKGTKRRWFQ